MVYRSSTEGGYGVGVSTDHVDASHANRIDIPDAELLFRGHFARSGPDLVLTGQDGHRLVVTGYFASEKHPDLVAPNGAHLSGDLVDLLAGSPTPGQYAQAKTTLPPEAIGKVEKVVGHVTLIHNGVAGPLHVGDPVYKTDVVETAANSSCGIAFPDGTALDLVNNTRMALNEYNFEANNSAANGAVFSLVEGTFAFVAGQVAHTGEGMKINTPVATMGIRGTVGLFRSEPTVIQSNLGHVWSVFLHEDIDGSHHLGRIALIDQDPSSPTFGQVFYLLDSSEYIAYLEPQGPGLPPHVRLEPITNSKVFDDRHFFDDLGQILNSFNAANPQAIPGTPGSGDNPGLLFNPLEQFLEEGGKPILNFVPLTPGSGTPPQLIFGGFPIIGGLLPNSLTPNGPNGPTSLSTVFIWNGTGAWPTAIANWNQGAAPNSSVDSVVIQSGTVTYDLTNTTISSLTVDPGATLDIIGGTLNTGSLVDNGTINVDGDPPALVVTGPVAIGSSGSLNVPDGSVTLTSGTFLNQGTVTVGHDGTLLINESSVTNDNAIVVNDSGSLTLVSIQNIENVGTIELNSTGDKTFLYFNQAHAILSGGGNIVLEGGKGSQDIIAAIPGQIGQGFTTVTLENLNNTISGAGAIGQGDGALAFKNDAGGTVEANISGQTLVIDTGMTAYQPPDLSGGDGDGVTITLVSGQLVLIGPDFGPFQFVEQYSFIGVTNQGLLEASAANATLLIECSNVENSGGTIAAVDGGIVTIEFANVLGGTLKADGAGSTLTAHDSGIDDATNGAILALDGGQVTLLRDEINGRSTDADGPGSQISIDSTLIYNAGGTITADHCATVLLDDAVINGGTLTSANGGIIKTVADADDGCSVSVFESLTNQGSVQVSDGTALELVGGIVNAGNIALAPGSAQLLIYGIVTLSGGGTITMAGLCDEILGKDELVIANGGIDETVPNTLDNVDNTIAGAGQIGDGSNALILYNEGTIDADIAGKWLVINTGAHTITNDGEMQATAGGMLDVVSNVCGDGTVFISDGGVAKFEGIFNEDVTFSGIGTAEFLGSDVYRGVISEFGVGDGIVVDFNYAPTERLVWDQATGILSLYNGCTLEETIHFAGTYTQGDFEIVDYGGKTEIVDLSDVDDEWTGSLPVGTTPEDRTGTWTTGSNWTLGVPNATLNAIIDLPGSYTVTLSGDQAANSLTITDSDAKLTGSGTLTLGSLENYGTIKVDDHKHLVIDFENGTNFGAIKAKDGTLSLEGNTFDDGSAQLSNYGRLVATDHGKISADDITLVNYSRILAADCGSVCVDHAKIHNESGGEIDAKDWGIVNIDDSSVRNGGIIDAERHGTIRIGHSFLKNTGTIEAVGLCGAIILSCDLIANTGTVLASDAGAVEITDTKFFNDGSGQVEATGCDSIITFCHDSIANKHGGEIIATGFGTVTFDDDAITNKHDSTIDASLGGLIKIDYSEIVNKDHSVIKAGGGGSVTLVDDCITNAGASTIEARGHDSTVNLDHTFVMNDGGTIAATGCDAVVNLVDTTIVGGTLETRHGGTIEVVAVKGDDTNMSVFDGSYGHAVTIDGYVLVEAGANLELKGTIHNEGMIEVDGRQTDLLIDGTVTLDGHGNVMLDNANHPADQIVGGDGDGNTLYNVNNTIEGAGNIGTGNGDLWLINESCGKIDANSCEQTLTLDTGGNQITNAGTLAASYGGILDVESSVNNSGGSIKVSDGGSADFEKSVTGGTATIRGGTLEFDAASNVRVAFDNGLDPDYGKFILKDWAAFTGDISGFAGCQANAAHSDEIELLNFDAQKLRDVAVYDPDSGITTLTIWDARHSALTDKLYFVGDYSTDDFAVKQVGENVVIFDPPETSSPSNPSVSIGGNDTFVFHPGEGAQTINNFNPQNETIELDHFANIQNVQELAAAITSDGQGDAVIELGHGDSIAVAGVSATFLQQHLQSLVHLH